MKFFSKTYRDLSEKIDKLEEIQKKIDKLNAVHNEVLRTVEEKEKSLLLKEKSIREEFDLKESFFKDQENALKKIISEKSLGFPWLANAIAEYYKFIDFEIADYLENKSHPAKKTADSIRSISIENSVLRKQLKIAQNFVNYYETLFPWITDYIGENLDELLLSINKTEEEEKDIDPVLKFMQKAEYDSLSEEVRNQKALDRYLSSRAQPWQIGRDYERYIGYLYEINGFDVTYQGIEKGLEDMGRDLICSKDNVIEIVQCKCWASYKTIHEKHINQLYGTAVKYYIENKDIKEKRNKKLSLFTDIINKGEIKATFITSTKLSETAMNFADALGINVIQEKPLEKYPIIKCNISISGEKIYHLPFDQQYDRTQIKNKGEFYALTVKDAVKKGFRRAYRWQGIGEDK